MRPWAAALVLVAAAVGARAADPSEPPDAAPVRVSATDGSLTARLRASPAMPAPGEVVDLLLEAELPPDPETQVVWPDVRAALVEALGEHVVEVESARAGPDGRTFTARLRLYDEGRHALPPLVVAARRGSETIGEAALEGAVLEVDVDVAADAAPAPARDPLPLELPPPPFPWLPVAAGAVVLAALAALVLRRRRRAPPEPPQPPPPPPHAKALAALRALAERSLPERGDVEPYFVELSEILRTYLEERFGLRAPEQTTEEFLAAVSHTEEGRRAIESAHRELLRDFLTRADLVKFARARPAPEECGAAGVSAERFVRETAAPDAGAHAAEGES